MIFWGHIGLTTALIKKVENKIKKEKNPIDYRFVAVGSILPDLIDKSIGFFLHNHALHGDRFIGHTLLFSLTIILWGTIRTSSTKSLNLLIVGICCFIHTVLDLMWVYPRTYFFPMNGLRIPIQVKGQVPQYAKIYFSTFFYYFFELVGFVLFCRWLIKGKSTSRIKSFIKCGIL